MVEQNKSPPAVSREPETYEEKLKNLPFRILRTHAIVASGLLVSGLGGSLLLRSYNEPQEQAAAAAFIQHSANSANLTKEDLKDALKPFATKEEFDELKQMISTNAGRPRQRPTLKKSHNVPR